MSNDKPKKQKNPNRVAAGKRTGKKSKIKGDSLERWVAKQLQDRYSDPKAELKDREFQRTPLSGGMKSSYPGDILIPDWWPFTIECKARRSFDIASSLANLLELGRENPILEVWDSESEKVKPGTSLLLVLKHWGRDPIVVMSDTCSYYLRLNTEENIKINYVTRLGPVNLYACTWSHFISCEKSDFVKLCSLLDPSFVIAKSEGSVSPVLTSSPKSQAMVEGSQSPDVEVL